MKLLITAAVSLLLVGQLPLFQVTRDFVLTDTEAIGLMPAQFIAGQKVVKGEWSPSGRFVLMTRKTPPRLDVKSPPNLRQGDYYLYDRSSERGTIIRKFDNEDSAQLGFTPNRDLIFATESLVIPSGPDHAEPGSEGKLIRFDPQTGTQQTMFDTGFHSGSVSIELRYDDRGVGLLVVEYFAKDLDQRPTAVTSGAPGVIERTQEFFVLDSAYSQIKKIDLKGGFESFDSQNNWAISNADGSKLYSLSPTGALTELDPVAERKRAKKRDQIAVNKWDIVSSTALHRMGNTNRSIQGAWMMSNTPSKKQFALVAPDSTGVQISRQRDAIFYISSGNAFIRPLMSVDKSVWLAAEQQDMMSRAKQLGLATIIYSADYDDELPNPDSINDKIDPYLKDRGMCEGFTYTFPGGNSTKIDKPAEQELGYVDGVGGRAIIYADGHVGWRKNP